MFSSSINSMTLEEKRFVVEKFEEVLFHTSKIFILDFFWSRWRSDEMARNWTDLKMDGERKIREDQNEPVSVGCEE